MIEARIAGPAAAPLFSTGRNGVQIRRTALNHAAGPAKAHRYSRAFHAMKAAALLRRFAVALCVAVIALSSNAQFVPISDDFSTAGALTGSTPDAGIGTWTAISGTSGSIQVTTGSASLSTSTSESTQLNFAASDQSTGTLYVGFDFVVSASGSISTSDTIQSVAGFRSGTAGTGSYAVGFGVFRPSGNAISFNGGLPSTNTTQVAVGIFTGSFLNASTSSLASWTSALNRGDTYRAVLGFNLDSDTVSLWINPASASASSITLSSVATDPRGIYLRQGSSSTGNLALDNLAVSTNFNTAAPSPPCPNPPPRPRWVARLDFSSRLSCDGAKNPPPFERRMR